jgi:heme-degrading monooxygenase HmoA
MRTSAVFVILAALACTASAIRVDDFLSQAQVGEPFADAIRMVTGSINKEHKAPGTLALIKYVVAPSKAEAFISVIKEAKKDAEEFKGYVSYSLVKTATDNISYWAFGAWESAEDLKEYLFSDAAKKVEKFLVKEDIPAFVTPLLPPLV